MHEIGLAWTQWVHAPDRPGGGACGRRSTRSSLGRHKPAGSEVRAQDSTRVGLRLSAMGTDVLYPAGVVFGLDEIILNIG